jgi:RNA polymerase sigma-70 factor (ECF subfamily)
MDDGRRMNDGAAWTAWLGRHGPAMVLLARQIVPARADAEDVVQEAFVRFWQVRHRADDPVAYLFTCVRNAALDWRRSGRRRGRREEAAARPEAADRASPFAPALEHLERRAAIEAALATLPGPQREVLVMKVWAKLTFPQIGRTLGISPDTAASRYRYALDKLRGQLAEWSATVRLPS